MLALWRGRPRRHRWWFGLGWEDCLNWQKCFGYPFHLSLTYRYGVCTVVMF